MAKKKEKRAREKNEAKKKLSFKRVLSNNIYALSMIWRSSPIYFTVYIGSSFVYGLLGFFSESYLLRKIVDGVERGDDIGGILTYVAVLAAVCITAYTALNYFWNVISPVHTRRILSDVEKAIFKKTSEVELECYENPEFYEKYVRAMSEAYNRMFEVLHTLDDLVSRLIALFANSLLLFTIDPVLVLFALVPFGMGIFRRFENKAHYDFETGRKKIDRENEYVKRTFYLSEYAKEMRVGGMYLYMLERFKEMLSRYKENAVKHGAKKMIFGFINQFGLHVVTILGATLYSVYSALVITSENGGMTTGDCIVVLGSIGIISTCLSELIQNVARFGEHALFLEDVRYFLEYEPTIKGGEIIAEGGGDIEIKNVSFRYTGSDRYALKNVSFSIKKGERIALIGSNGSGKTTLVKLLLRLYDPSEGEMIYGGKDVRSYTLSSYRSLFGAMFQDYRVLSLSVKENVLMRREREGDGERVISALKESLVYDRVMKMEKGIETTLTREFDKSGENLSGGEAQKLSLARVFASDAEIAVLDEPSSALDPIAEYKMFESMMRACEGKSVIFISHRLSSAVLADKVVLMKDGEVCEVGTHTALMEKGGLYAEMFKRQAENYLGSEVSTLV